MSPATWHDLHLSQKMATELSHPSWAAGLCTGSPMPGVARSPLPSWRLVMERSRGAGMWLLLTHASIHRSVLPSSRLAAVCQAPGWTLLEAVVSPGLLPSDFWFFAAPCCSPAG